MGQSAAILNTPRATKRKTKAQVTIGSVHAGQVNLFKPVKQKWRIGCCGTKWGKTLALSMKVATLLLNSKKPIQILWAAPYYQNAKVGFKYVKKMFPKSMVLFNEIVDENKSELSITLKHNGATVYFKGVNTDPEAVEGEAYHYVVIDEASKMVEQALVSIRTTTGATQAQIDVISTPRGRNHFHERWLRGQQEGDPDYISFRFPTADNPHFSKKEIERAKRELPKRLFEQYYLAQFVADSLVFSGYQACEYGDNIVEMPWIHPDAAKMDVVIGTDWGKTNDWTVFTALDRKSNRMVGIDRFQFVNYDEAIRRLIKFNKRFGHVEINLHDKTGLGGPIDDMLVHTDLPYEGFTFTNQSKVQIVNQLITACEYQDIGLIKNKQLQLEIENFEVSTTKTGKVTYEGGLGQHDDMIMSLALANTALIDYSDKEYTIRWQEDLAEDEQIDELTDREKLYRGYGDE